MTTIYPTNIDNLLENLAYNSLPLYSDSNYSQTLNINNIDYIFKVQWNNLYSFWTISIYNTTNELLHSCKIVPCWNLSKNVTYNTKLNIPIIFSTNNISPSKYPDQFSITDEHNILFTNLVSTDEQI